MTRNTTYDQSFPSHAPAPRVQYYDAPSLQWKNFRTIRKKPAPRRIVGYDIPPGLGMGSMVSDNWYRFHLGHLQKPTIFKEGEEDMPGPQKEELIDRDDIRDIVKTKTLVSTNKSFYKNLPMVKTEQPNMAGVRRPLDEMYVRDRPGDLPQLSRVPRCSGERRLPGYTGYIPQTPIQRSVTPTFSYDATTVNTTHRPFPAAAHDTSPFGRTGVLSRHVTLTHPFNPYNSVH